MKSNQSVAMESLTGIRKIVGLRNENEPLHNCTSCNTPTPVSLLQPVLLIPGNALHRLCPFCYKSTIVHFTREHVEDKIVPVVECDGIIYQVCKDGKSWEPVNLTT